MLMLESAFQKYPGELPWSGPFLKKVASVGLQLYCRSSRSREFCKIVVLKFF